MAGAYFYGAFRAERGTANPAAGTTSPAVQPSPTSGQAITPSTGEKGSVLPKPSVQQAYFSNQVVDYPPDWPSNLRYPASFILHETSSQKSSVKGGVNIWVAKLSYHGDEERATNAIRSFFTSQGWVIGEQLKALNDPILGPLKSGSIIDIRQNNGKGDATVLFYPDTNPSYTRILIEVYLS